MIKNHKQQFLEPFFQVYPNLYHKEEGEELNKYKEFFKKPVCDNIFHQFEKKSNLKYPRRSKSKKLFDHKIKIENCEIEKEKNYFEDSKNNNNFINTKKYKSSKKSKKESDYYLIKKGIFLQDNKLKRTGEVKKGLKLFLMKSKLIQNISNNLNIGSIDVFSKEEKDEKKIKMKNRINNIVISLSEQLIIKKYPKNTFVVKINEIGEECYFLISGKISVLKPVAYDGIKISYKDYLIYLKRLLNLEEIYLVMEVLHMNHNFLDIKNIEDLNKLINAYFKVSFNKELNKNINNIQLEEIENFFKKFHFSFEDFQIILYWLILIEKNLIKATSFIKTIYYLNIFNLFK